MALTTIADASNNVEENNNFYHKTSASLRDIDNYFGLSMLMIMNQFSPEEKSYIR
jgi:hypothetical protein